MDHICQHNNAAKEEDRKEPGVFEAKSYISNHCCVLKKRDPRSNHTGENNIRRMRLLPRRFNAPL